MSSELVTDFRSALGTSTNMLMPYVPSMSKKTFSVTVISKENSQASSHWDQMTISEDKIYTKRLRGNEDSTEKASEEQENANRRRSPEYKIPL